MNTQAIGIFDSGFGGISVLKELYTLLPRENYIYYGDNKYAPYGLKTKEEIIQRCISICDLLVEKGVKAIIVACNTATSVAITQLRSRYTIPIIGMEPALKVAAAQNDNQNIAVMATPLTLVEKKFNTLMNQYAKHNTIYKIPCPELVNIVEEDALHDTSRIQKQLHVYFKDIPTNLDSIVLGCTHFVFLKEPIQQAYPMASVIDGNKGTCLHLYNILKEKDALQTQGGSITFLSSSEKIELANRLFHL